MKLKHAALVSSSLENADRFYGSVLGLKKAKSSTLSRDLAKEIFDTDLECQYILFKNESLAIEVFITTLSPAKIAPFAHICIEVEARDEFLEKCRSKGLEVNSIPKGESHIVFIKDYDGNLFEIKAG